MFAAISETNMRSSLAVCVIGITMLYLVSTVKPEPVSCDPDPHGNKTCGANECCFMEPLKENEEPWGKKGICKDKIEMGNGTKRSKCSPLPKGLHGPGRPGGPWRPRGHEGTGGQREEQDVPGKRGGQAGRRESRGPPPRGRDGPRGPPPERHGGSRGQWESRGQRGPGGPPPGGPPPGGPRPGGYPPGGHPPGGHPPGGQHTGDEICECQQDLICSEEGICEEGVGQIDERGGAENRDGPGAGENRQGGPNPGGEGQDESSAQGGS